MNLVVATSLAPLLVGCSDDGSGSAESAGTRSSTTSSTPPTTVSSDERAVDWLADLEALDAGVTRIHPNAFWRVGAEEWERRIMEARALLPTLTDRQAEMVFFELSALLDGHSGIYPFDIGYHLYELRLYHFTDGYFLLDGPDATAIGGELVAINGVPIEEAVALVTPLVPYDNDKSIELMVPMFLMIAEILEGTGIVTDTAAPAFDILRVDGSHAILNPGVLLWDPYVEQFDAMPIGLPQSTEPLSQSRRDDAFWWTMIEDVLYLQYNQAVAGEGTQTIGALAQQVRERLEVGDVRRVVVDIRHNAGGDSRTYAPLKSLLLDPLVDRPGGLFVIIGRHTFSAGTLFATEIEAQSVSAVFVGEPTGGRPNVYADPMPLKLVSSGINVYVSSGYYDFASPNDPRPWIPPDIPVELSSADYFAGLDPVLQAAIDA